MVLLETGAAGAAAIELARALAVRRDSSLTVVSVVPQASGGPRCGNSAREFNTIVMEQVAAELGQARAHLGDAAQDVRFELLIEGVDPPLAEWSAAAGFDLILVPARRRSLRHERHPEAARLRRETDAEVRVVSPGPVDRAMPDG